MMKNIYSSAALGSLFFAALTFAGDFELTINGKKHELNLDQEVALELEDGTKVQVKIAQKEYLTFGGKGFQFEHHKSMLPAVSELGDGVTQMLLATPRGTGVMIQTYEGVNPNSLIETMIQELTKEEVEVGYTLTKEKSLRKVGEKEFHGAIATTTSKAEDEQWAYEVVASGDDSGGILIVTFVENDNKNVDGKVVERFWKTLTIGKK